MKNIKRAHNDEAFHSDGSQTFSMISRNNCNKSQLVLECATRFFLPALLNDQHSIDLNSVDLNWWFDALHE